MSHTIPPVLRSQVNDLLVSKTSCGLNTEVGQDSLYRPREGILHGGRVVGSGGVDMLSYLRRKSQF